MDASDKTPAPGGADDADCAGIENASVDARLQNCASAAANEKAPERAAVKPAPTGPDQGGPPDKTADRPDSGEAEEETEDFGRNAQETPWSG